MGQRNTGFGTHYSSDGYWNSNALFLGLKELKSNALEHRSNRSDSVHSNPKQKRTLKIAKPLGKVAKDREAEEAAQDSQR